MPKVGRKFDSFVDSPRHPYNNDLLAEAPFGTQYTPQVRVRIVGGKQQMVEDEPIPMPHQYESPRLQFLEKDLTQRLERLENSVYTDNNSLNQNLPSPRGQRRTVNYQPLNPHPVLPPIPAIPPAPPAPPAPRVPPLSVREVVPDENRLYGLLPRDSSLTARPLRLNDSQTTLLYQILSHHLTQDDTHRLKDVYLSLVSHDLRMTGYVPFEAFRMVFHKNQLYLPLKLLRLLGSMYVSQTGMDMVQYENILIFIGAALKNATTFRHTTPMRYSDRADAVRDMGPIPYERPTYYQYQGDNKAEHISPRHPVPARRTLNRTDVNLHRKLEDVVVLSPRFDVERLRQAFIQEDRTRHGTMSPQQLKQIVVESGLNVGDALLDDVIRRCDDFQGQIRWDEFLEHIERVQPLRTGLHIPPSKRPLDYARPQHTPRDAPCQNGYASPSCSPRLQDGSHRVESTERGMNGDKLEMGIRDLEQNYQKNKEALLRNQRYGPGSEYERSMSPVTDTWFSRFMKLADALYKNDVEHSGFLRPEEVRWLMGEYNDIFDLRIPLSIQENALQTSRNHSGQVDINNLLGTIAKTKIK